MKKWLRMAAWPLLAGVVLGGAAAWRRAPVGGEGIAARAYEGWAGVLRVWVCAGWQPGYGSFVPWLNQRAARFEKTRPGVYVQIESVGAAALTAFRQMEPLPDAILFAPGMLDSGEGLRELKGNPAVRPELDGAGDWENQTRALPVAMGGYAWAINRAMLEDVPLNWAALTSPEPLKKQARYLMQVPMDEAYRCWSGALCALCAPRRVTAQGAIPDDSADEGVDLGLPEEAPARPTPPPETVLALCGLPASLPDDFLAGDDFYAGFTQGLYAAIPVTQREIRRLQILGESGRAPDWAVAGGGAAFTDQLLMMAIPESVRRDGAARVSLAEEFLSYLLTEESQKALTSVRALSVVRGDALYGADQGMAELEKSARGTLFSVNAFDSSYRAQWRAQAKRLAREAQGENLSG